MTRLMVLLPCLLLLACKNPTTDTTDTQDTPDTGDTAETGVTGATVAWDFFPDPGLAAPAAVALRVAGGDWEAVDVKGDRELGDEEGAYELLMACVPSEGQPHIVLIAATAGELPVPRLVCPWLAEGQQVDIEVTVEDLGLGQTALVGVGRESLLATADAPPPTGRPVAGIQDVTLAYSAVLATGRSTFSLDVLRQQDVGAGPLSVPSAGLVETSQSTASPPSLSLNSEPAILSTTVSLWTAGGTLGELGTGVTPEFSYGAAPAGALADGDRVFVRAVSDDGQHDLVSVSPPGGELQYEGIDGEATVSSSIDGGTLALDWVSECGLRGVLDWMGSAVLTPADAATWTVFVQPERTGADPVTFTHTLPDLADVPGFEVGWSWGELEPADILAGNFAVQTGGEQADPAAVAAGMLLSVAGTGSGLVGPEELLGTDASFTAVRMLTTVD